MNALTRSEKERTEGQCRRSHSSVLSERKKEQRRRRREARHLCLTVIVMSLKGSIIAARAYKHDGGRGDRKSTIITEGEGDLKNTDDLKTGNKSRQGGSSENHL